MRRQRACFAHHAETVRSRQADIRHHQGMLHPAELFERLARVGRRIHVPVASEEMRLQRRPHPGFVVHHQDSIHFPIPPCRYICLFSFLTS